MIVRGRVVLAAALAVGGGLLMWAPARADQVVYFVNGKAITAKKVEKGDRITVLEIEGGGRIGVPTVQIDRIEELQLSAPGPAVAMVAPAAVQPATLPTQVVAPGQQAAVASAPSGGPAAGPGIGGQSALPAGSLMGPKPLSLGGDDSVGSVLGKVAAPTHPGAQPAGNQAAGTMPGMGPTGQTMRTDGGISGGPGAGGNRRFNARGGAFGRGRPPAATYYMPPAQGAPGQQPGAAQGGQPAKPPGAQQPGTQAPATQTPAAQTPPQQPTAQTPPPPPSPPPVQEPPPPPPDDQGTGDSSNTPPPDDPGPADPPANDNPPGGQR